MLSNEVTELEKYGFKSKAYKQNGNTWKQVQLVIVNAQFDGIDMNQIVKIKVKGERLKPDGLFLKVTTKQEDHFYSVEKQYHFEWFSRVIWAKVYALNQKNPSNHFELKDGCEGGLLVKGSFGGWN